MSKKFAIAVAYYKEAPIIQNECLFPMQVGKAVSDYDLGMVGDDTGDNISDQNFSYAELTGIYWLWKNSDAEYKGLCHYRRFLDLDPSSLFKNYDEYTIRLDEDFDGKNFLDKLMMTSSKIEEILHNNDAITLKLGDLCNWSDYTVESHYKSEHIGEHLDFALEVLSADYPEYLKTAKKLLSGTTSYFTNILIMKNQDFCEYCEFIFDILEKVKNKINPYDKELAPTTPQSRWAGFLAERLTSIYLTQKKKERGKIAEFPLVIIEPSDGSKWFECDTRDVNLYAKVSENKVIAKKQEFNGEFPKVSVLMAAYNSSQFIEQAVRSVTSQSLSDIEIIIVDDGSTENTLEIIECLAKKDSRLKVISQKNTRLGYVRNAGLIASKGKFIHFMDADDYMDEDFLESMVKNAEKYDSDIVISNHKCFEENTGQLLYTSILPHTLYQGKMNVKTHPDLFLTPCHVWDKLFRRDFIKDVRFPKEMSGEDIVFWWEVILKARKVSIYRTPKFNYRMNTQSAQAIPDLMLNAFLNIKRTENMVRNSDFGIVSYDEIKEYYQIMKEIQIPHMIYRGSLALKIDQDFREKFFSEMKAVLSTSVDVSEAINRKRAYLPADQIAIKKLCNMKTLEEFTEFVSGSDIFNIQLNCWRYWIMSKVTFGKARKRYKAKKKKNYQELKIFKRLQSK